MTVFDIESPIETTTGMALPGAIPAGTRTFTWYSPIVPGARPEKRTLALIPPMVTVGVVVVSQRDVVGAGEPVFGGLVTTPRPVP